MPSREDVVEWLREAALTERSLAIGAKTGAIPAHFYDECIANAVKFEQRAAQVSAMRCETCKKEAVYTGIDEWVACPWSCSGGCFHYEQKVTK